MCYQFRPEIYGLQEQMGIADFSRMTRPFTIERPTLGAKVAIT